MTPSTPTAANTVRTAKIEGVKGGTGDTTRDKCIELIYDGLACDSSARKYIFPSIRLKSHGYLSAIDLILKRAQGLEKAVFSDFGGTTAEYKSKIRSLYVNLKDKNNPDLRENVVSGELSVEKLSKMTSQVYFTRSFEVPSINVFPGNGVRGEEKRRPENYAGEFSQVPRGGRAAGRNRCVSVFPMQTSTTFSSALLTPSDFIIFRENAIIARPRPAVLMSR